MINASSEIKESAQLGNSSSEWTQNQFIPQQVLSKPICRKPDGEISAANFSNDVNVTVLLRI